MSEESSDAAPPRPEFWCDICSLDLQSSASLATHELGRKHTRKAFWEAHYAAASGAPRKRPPISSILEPIDEDEVFQNLALGKYRNVVVLTGAGVSTAAGIPDFRSEGGAFDTIRRVFGDRFPRVHDHPEYVLTRSFAEQHPECAVEVRSLILEPAGQAIENVAPTPTHKLCAWLHRRGVLRRVYSQNIDGLHLHPSLNMPDGLVVECHGALRDGARSLVMYGDTLPQRFHDCSDVDFPLPNTKTSDYDKVDLLLVFGTSLQVAPFCGLPNMTPRGATRVLVNRDLDVCLQNNFSKSSSASYEGGSTGIRQVSSCRIGSRKSVPLRPMFASREGHKRWRQLVVEDDCDDFVARFFDSPFAKAERCNMMGEVHGIGT